MGVVWIPEVVRNFVDGHKSKAHVYSQMPLNGGIPLLGNGRLDSFYLLTPQSGVNYSGYST